jgi:hypothetical protein
MNRMDEGGWESVRSTLADLPLPEDPNELDRATRLEIARRLVDEGWSFREMAAALGVPSTTLHRHLVGEAAKTTPFKASNKTAIAIIAGIASIVFLVLRKPRGAA